MSASFFNWYFLFEMMSTFVDSSNPLLMVNANSVILSTIVNQFYEWDIIVHIDDERMDFLTILGDQESGRNPMTIYNYNDYNHKFVRPKVHRCVNFIVQMNHEFFLNYSRLEGNVIESDIVMFFTRTLSIEDDYSFLYNSGVDNANMAFYLNRTMAFAIFFYNAPAVSADVRLVTRDANDVPQLHKYHNSFKNFRGFPLTVGYTNCPPFIYTEDKHIIGVEYKVLETVIKQLNFTPIFADYSNRMDPRKTLIADVNKSVLHFGIGCLSNNIRRNEMVAFSAALQIEPHITIYSTNAQYEQTALYAIFAPLHYQVWICCGVTLVVLSISVKLLIALERKNVQANPILVPFRILLEQSTNIPTRSNALRFGLFTWILVGFALSSSYKSKLTSALIMPSTREPEKLSQLLSNDYKFISPAEDSTYLIELLMFSSDPVEYKVGATLEDTKVVCTAIERALAENSAVVDEQTVIRYRLWNYCKQNLTLNQMWSLRRLPEATTLNGHLWAMPKSAPYKNRISEILETMKSYGLVEKWYQGYNLTRPIPVSNSVKKRGDTEPLVVSDLMAAFIVLGFGCVVSGTAFLLETFLYQTSQHNFRPILRHTNSKSKIVPSYLN